AIITGEIQPVPYIAEPPVHQWRERIRNVRRWPRLEPALPALAAVLRAGHRDTRIADGTFTHANSCDLQEFLAGHCAQVAERRLHRLYLQLCGTPPKRIRR